MSAKIVELFLTETKFKDSPEGAVIERPTYYAVGRAIQDEGNPVKSISNRRLQTFGYEGPCYVIEFEGSDNRQVVPMCRVMELTVNSTNKKREEEPPPPLPGE